MTKNVNVLLRATNYWDAIKEAKKLHHKVLVFGYRYGIKVQPDKGITFTATLYGVK